MYVAHFHEGLEFKLVWYNHLSIIIRYYCFQTSWATLWCYSGYGSFSLNCLLPVFVHFYRFCFLNFLLTLFSWSHIPLYVTCLSIFLKRECFHWCQLLILIFISTLLQKTFTFSWEIFISLKIVMQGPFLKLSP